MIMVYGWLIILIAAAAQGLTGFGFALIAVPLLSLILPFSQIVPIVVGLSLVSNLVMTWRLYKHVEIKKIWLLIVIGFIGIPLGSYLLLALDAVILKMGVGLLIISFSFLLLRKVTFPIQNEYLAFPIVGLLSGILNGSISTSGPPLVLFLTNQGKDQQVFKANLSVYGTALNFFTLAVFYFNGTLDSAVTSILLQMLVIMIVGTGVGMALARWIDQQMFRKLVIYLLIASSISMIAGAL